MMYGILTMSTGPILRRSPDRHTFQNSKYIERKAEEGKTVDNDENVRAMSGFYEMVRAREDQQEADPEWRKNNLEWDLRTSDRLCAKVQDTEYAKKLYAALCNTDWLRTEVIPLLRQDPDKDLWSCSWRYAGGIIAHMREEGDYIDWYCSGNEGYIDPEVAEDLKQLGWQGIDSDGAWV
jgi:hypothetical protein